VTEPDADPVVPVVPVVLVHYRAPEWIAQSVGTLLASRDAEVAVTVVNNGGDVSSLPDTVRVLTPGSNTGYAGGMNVGLREWLAGAEPYCLVGAHDLQVEPDTVRRLVDAAEAAPEFGIVAPWFVPRVARVNELGEHNGLVEFEWVSGSGFLLRRACAQQVGLFDEDFGSYTEDHELCLRARAGGWRVGAVRHAIATTNGSAHHDRALVMMHGNEMLLAAKLGDRRALAQLARGELSGAATQFRQAFTRSHSSRRALRRSWTHLRSLAFGGRQLARWARRGRPVVGPDGS